MDNLLQFLKNNFLNQFLFSGENGDLLIWGQRDQNNVFFLGLSFNIQIGQNLTRNGLRLMAIGTSIAEMLNVPFMLIQYPQNLGETLQKILINNTVYAQSEAPQVIQNILKTNLNQFGTGKEVNDHTSDPFHKWARSNLPSNYIRIDVDGLLLDNAKDRMLLPKVLIEVKRSTKILPITWQPYNADIRNYYLEKMVADKLSIPYITLNHNCLDNEITNDAKVGFFLIEEVTLDPAEILSAKKLLSPDDLRQRLFQLL